MRTDRFLVAAAFTGLAMIPSMGLAQSMPEPIAEVPMRDPWVPPAVREKSLKAPAVTSGATLDAQVEAKLRARFDAAARGGATLTREQARIAGLGAIEEQFDAIDRERRGAVTFEDYRRYLAARRINY